MVVFIKSIAMEEEIKKPKGIEEGPPMWVESMLSHIEWKEQAKLHRKTYKRNSSPPNIANYTLYWRKGMGASLKQEEIDNINHNINYLLQINTLKH